MGSTASLLKVKEIVGHETEPMIVVVSALGGVTNQLLSMTEQALGKDSAYEATLAQLEERHMGIISDVVPAKRQQECREFVGEFISMSLGGMLRMLCLNDVPADIVADMRKSIVSCGEILSSAIVTMMLGAVPRFAPGFIKTHRVGDDDVPDMELTADLIRKEMGAQLPAVTVTQGFISHDAATDKDTNLGRGGSDFTAALIAAALDADALEIWTDVDGFLSADPRVVPEARLVNRLSFAQAEDLCNGGAKVVYYPTIAPVREAGIPTWVKNTFRPEVPGTLIGGEMSEEAVAGVTSKGDMVTVVTQTGADLARLADELMRALMADDIALCPVSRTPQSVTFRLMRGDVTQAVRMVHRALLEQG